MKFNDCGHVSWMLDGRIFDRHTVVVILDLLFKIEDEAYLDAIFIFQEGNVNTTIMQPNAMLNNPEYIINESAENKDSHHIYVP